MISITFINVGFDTGEHLTLTTTEANLYAKGGYLIGHAGIEEFYEFLKDKLADVRHEHDLGEYMDAVNNEDVV